MIKVGIIGATGYAGQQLASIIYTHPEADITFLCSNSYAGQSFSDVYPHYKGILDNTLISADEAMAQMSHIDVLFTALPHATAFLFVSKAIENNVKVVDLGADFRLDDVETFETWYNCKHDATHLLDQAVYGLSELWMDQMKDANLIANPGCYTTASILAMAPALSSNIINKDTIIIDAKSGVTGAGRKPDVSLLLTECSETIKAYGIANHRHTPEIEQELSKVSDADVYINFTPHLVPMQRGILATCYASMTEDLSLDEVYKIYKDFYKDAPFVRVREDNLETRFTRFTNYCDISLRIDPRTKRIIITSTLDNLVKGAAGQAVQNMNIIFGLDQTLGLTMLPK